MENKKNDNDVAKGPPEANINYWNARANMAPIVVAIKPNLPMNTLIPLLTGVWLPDRVTFA